MSAWAIARDAVKLLAAAGIDNPQFEAEYLARVSSSMTRADYFAGRPLDSAARSRFADAVERRLRGEPAAYISGRREFHGHEFAVGPGVLIPRPETEMLVDAAVAELGRLGGEAVVVDVGTGSGCIAISVALDAPDACVIGLDLSGEALATARGNARSLGAAVELVRGDLLSAIRRADIVIANLPYIPSGEIAALQRDVRDWEPRVALDGGADGLDLIRPLFDECAHRLRPRLAALEVAAGQAPAVRRIAESLGASVAVYRDLAGIERMVCASWE